MGCLAWEGQICPDPVSSVLLPVLRQGPWVSHPPAYLPSPNRGATFNFISHSPAQAPSAPRVDCKHSAACTHLLAGPPCPQTPHCALQPELRFCLSLPQTQCSQTSPGLATTPHASPSQLPLAKGTGLLHHPGSAPLPAIVQLPVTKAEVGADTDSSCFLQGKLLASAVPGTRVHAGHTWVLGAHNIHSPPKVVQECLHALEGG